MTKLTKIIRRETADTSYRGKPLVVELRPPNLIAVKEKGKRDWYVTTIECVFDLAIKQSARSRMLEGSK